MIRHITITKLKEQYRNEKDRREVADKIRTLKDNIDYMRSMYCEPDNVQMSRFGNSWDIYMDTTFDSYDDLQKYLHDKYHMEVVHPFVEERMEKYCMVDFEVKD